MEQDTFSSALKMFTVCASVKRLDEGDDDVLLGFGVMETFWRDICRVHAVPKPRTT